MKLCSSGGKRLRCAPRIRIALTFTLLLPLAARADVLLQAPARISFYEAPTIRIAELRALETIILVTTVTDARGTQFTSRASFRADVDGVVDTKRSVANGDYEGIDAMGPFWSVRGEGAFRLPLTGAIPTTIRVENADGRALASATIAWPRLAQFLRATLGPR